MYVENIIYFMDINHAMWWMKLRFVIHSHNYHAVEELPLQHLCIK